MRDRSKDDVIREVITSDAIITHVEHQNKVQWLINEILESKEMKALEKHQVKSESLIMQIVFKEELIFGRIIKRISKIPSLSYQQQITKLVHLI